MKELALACALTLLGGCAANSETSDPSNAADMVLTNANIYAESNASAVAIRNGEITFIGTDSDIRAYIGKNTETIDLEGQLLLPGFIDNHSHLGEGGEVTCFPENGLTLEQQANQLSKCASGVAAGKWIIGYGMELEVVLGEGNVMNRPIDTLDRIFPDNPVIIMEHTSHAMFVNSLALERANINLTTADPQGGKIMKDETGNLNGVLVDNAGDIVMEIAVNEVDNKFDVFYEGILYGLDEARKNGITTVGDGRTYWRRGMYDAWKEVEANNDLTVRISLRPWIYPELEQQEQTAFLALALQNDLSKDLIVNQVKMYSDGVPENGTAKVAEPYALTWFPDIPYGLNYIPENAMKRWLAKLDELGYGAHIHAIGDLGVKETLNAIEAARSEGSKKIYNITHLSMMDESDVDRFAQLNVDADIQIAEAKHSHEEHMEDFLPLISEKRAAELLYRPVKELQETGANVVLSSDWTVHPMSPLLAISHAVEEKSLTIEQAIDAYTINPAKALGLESITGSIAVGMSADFAVLDKDITRLAATEITKSKVAFTIYRGEVVYEAF